MHDRELGNGIILRRMMRGKVRELMVKIASIIASFASIEQAVLCGLHPTCDTRSKLLKRQQLLGR
jgi:hypothetical protein